MITYRPADAEKPVSCSLNELEVFSCVLGLEEETALSIVEPAALHVTIDAARVLHVSVHTIHAATISLYSHCHRCHVVSENPWKF